MWCERDDKGQRIDINKLDVTVSVLGVQLGQYSATIHDEDVEPATGLPTAPNGFFQTANGAITLLIAGEYLWDGLCEVLAVPEWDDDDHRHGTNEGRGAGPPPAVLEANLRERPTGEWLQDIHARRESISSGLVNEVSEMVADKQVRAQSVIFEDDYPDLGRYVAP
jgi:crotonobetainyl-CoA:carnitine CoA-transferase CaiB-like acyl-CoA transferase